MDKLREAFGQKKFDGFLVIIEEGFKVPIKTLEALSRGPLKDKKPRIMYESIFKMLKEYEYNTTPILYLIEGDDIKNGNIIERDYNDYNKGKFYRIKNNHRNTALYIGPPIENELLQKVTGRQFFYHIGTTPQKAMITPLQEDFDVIELKDPIKNPDDLVLSEPIQKAGKKWFYIKNSTDKEDIKGLQDIGQDAAALIAAFMDKEDLSEIKDEKLLSRVEAVKLDLTEKEFKLKQILERKNRDVGDILKELYEKGYKDSEILKVAKKYTDKERYLIIDELIHMINDINSILQSPKEAQVIKDLVLEDNRDEALKYASSHGYLEVVRLLLKHGANPSKALLVASFSGHLEVVRLLLEKGANVHVNDDKPLRYASSHGYLEVVRLLLEKGADLHIENDRPLYNAAFGGYLEVVRLLLEKGANVNAQHVFQDIYFYDALYGAVSKGYAEVVRLLLENGANVYEETIKLAISKEHHEVVLLLLENLKEPKEGESPEQKILRLETYRRALHEASLLLGEELF